MVEFIIQDMTCGSCARKITEAITQLDSQAEVEIDLKNKQISIVSVLSDEALKADIAASGYTPVPVLKVISFKKAGD